MMPPARGKRPQKSTKHNKVSVPKRRKVEPPANDSDPEVAEDEADGEENVDLVTEVMKEFDRKSLTIWHVPPMKNFDYSKGSIRKLKNYLKSTQPKIDVLVKILPGVAGENDHEALVIHIREYVQQKEKTLTCIFGSSGLKHKSKQVYLPIMIANGIEVLVKRIARVFQEKYESTIVPLELNRLSTVQSLSAYWLYRMMRFGNDPTDEIVLVFHTRQRSDQVKITLPASCLQRLSGNLKKVKMQHVWTLIIDALKKHEGFEFDSSITIVSVQAPKFQVSIPQSGKAKLKLSITDKSDAEYLWSAVTHLSEKLNPQIR